MDTEEASDEPAYVELGAKEVAGAHSVRVAIDEVPLRPGEPIRSLDEEALLILERWYSSYHKISLFLGTVAGGLIFFLVTIFYQEFGKMDQVKSAIVASRNQIIVMVSLIGLSLLLTFFCVITTYGWYVTGLSQILARTNRNFSWLGDKFDYRDPEKMGSMGTWGRLSLGTGWASGILLAGGIFVTVWLLIKVMLSLK